MYWTRTCICGRFKRSFRLQVRLGLDKTWETNSAWKFRYATLWTLRCHDADLVSTNSVVACCETQTSTPFCHFCLHVACAFLGKQKVIVKQHERQQRVHQKKAKNSYTQWYFISTSSISMFHQRMVEVYHNQKKGIAPVLSPPYRSSFTTLESPVFSKFPKVESIFLVTDRLYGLENLANIEWFLPGTIMRMFNNMQC